MSVELGSDVSLCQGDTITYFADADTTTVNYIWRWDNVTTSTPLSSDKYFVNTANITPGNHVLSIETNDGSTTTQCPGLDNVNVEVIYQPDINGTISDTAFCEGGSVTIDAGPGTHYQWTFFKGLGGTKVIGVDGRGSIPQVTDAIMKELD